MTIRRLYITCPGATSAGVVATLLIADRATFSARPLGDGRWIVEADVDGRTAARVEAQTTAPVIIEGEAPQVSEPPAPEPEAAPPAPPPPTPSAVPLSGDTIAFEAPTERAAKVRATKLALEKWKARPYDEPWSAGEAAGVWVRTAYRGKRTGELVLMSGDSAWSVIWRDKVPAAV